MTDQELFTKWEDRLEWLLARMKIANDAKLQYDSTFAAALRRVKATEPATLAQTLTKGEPDVLEAAGTLMETERMVFAGKAIIEKLEAEVATQRLHDKIVAGRIG